MIEWTESESFCVIDNKSLNYKIMIHHRILSKRDKKGMNLLLRDISANTLYYFP